MALGRRRSRCPETQVYTHIQHLAHIRPDWDTVDTPLGWILESGCIENNSIINKE